MAGLVPAIHGLRVDPAEVVDASLRWHDRDDAPKRRFQRRLLGWTAQRHLVPKLSCQTATKGRPHEV
jgi:hypothetical protein